MINLFLLVYAGVGFSWNTIDETFRSNLSTNENRSGKDQYETQQVRLAPTVEIGHQFCFNGWTGSLEAQWQFLNYKTPNLNSSRGQILPNATFSSINFFGPMVVRDFTSKTRLYNEVKLMAQVGRELFQGSAYLGLGPVFFNASNSLYVSSVHMPNGTGDHLVSTSVRSQRIIWGGAFQAGYHYCPCSNFSVNLGYTYMQTGRNPFNNTINAAVLNGFTIPGSTFLTLKRTLEFSIQEFFGSINLLF